MLRSPSTIYLTGILIAAVDKLPRELDWGSAHDDLPNNGITARHHLQRPPVHVHGKEVARGTF